MTSTSATTELPFAPIWLRDNCQCAECRDPLSGQKLFGITDLAPDVSVLRVEASSDPITVTFGPDGHRGEFSRSWLLRPDGENGAGSRTESGKAMWRAADIEEQMPAFAWADYSRCEAERASALRMVQRLGFALLKAGPVAEGTVLDVVATFGYVRETNYGRIFDVRVQANPSNLAFTGLPILPHTDNPYRDPVPTIQVLHCVRNSVAGGESGLVDGFCAAAALRYEDPVAFDALTRTLVRFSWSDAGTRLSAEHPLIEVDAQARIRAVRFNNRSMQALRLPADETVTFYAAYRRFAEIIARPEMLLVFRLEAGDSVIFDNTRLLHARTGFADSGSRHLQGSYSDLDGLESTLSMIESRP